MAREDSRDMTASKAQSWTVKWTGHNGRRCQHTMGSQTAAENYAETLRVQLGGAAGESVTVVVRAHHGAEHG